MEVVIGVTNAAPAGSASTSPPSTKSSTAAPKPVNGTTPQSSSKVFSSPGSAATSQVQVAPGSAGSKINVKYATVISWIGAVIIFGILW